MNRVSKWIMVLAFVSLVTVLAGCSSSEPQNASVRPWNSPQSWEGALPVDMGQHE
jgi:hypothetical protein